VRQPAGPASLHLQTLLSRLPPSVQAVVALPASSGEAGRNEIGHPAVTTRIRPTPDTGWGRLHWEQVVLPGLAKQSGAHLIHLMEANPPLAAPCPVVVSPCGYGQPERLPGPALLAGSHPRRRASLEIPQRLRRALVQGGAARLQAVFWPEDLPSPAVSNRVVLLPPCVPPGFEPAGLEGTEGVLYHGPGDPVSLLRLLAGWSWAAAAALTARPDHPLVVAGLDPVQEALLRRFLEESSRENDALSLPEGSLRCVHPSTRAETARLYRSAGVVFHPAALSPWGDPALHALACARAVVTGENPQADARLGPAGYLAPLGDPRRMGAALVTLLVDDDLAAQLAEAAWQRSAGWRCGEFGAALEAAYWAVSH